MQKSTLTRKGLKYDRCCMFIDAKGVFITIRDKPEMTLIKTALSEKDGQPTLEITFPQVSKNSEGQQVPDYNHSAIVSVPLEPDQSWLDANTELVSAEIWQFETDAYAITAPSTAEIISNYFTSWDKDSNVRLVIKGPTARPCGGNGDEQYLGRKEYVNFPDVLPVQVASEVSLRELNGRLSQASAKEITIERFRPNIIVDSDNLVPWEEDEWKVLRINPPTSWTGSISTLTGIGSQAIDVDVSAVSCRLIASAFADKHKRCARCHVPNVDPDTAVPDKKEPWGTVSRLAGLILFADCDSFTNTAVWMKASSISRALVCCAVHGTKLPSKLACKLRSEKSCQLLVVQVNINMVSTASICKNSLTIHSQRILDKDDRRIKNTCYRVDIV